MENEQATSADMDATGASETGDPGDASDAGLVGESGEPRVDAAVRALRGLDQVPLPEHPAIFEAVHGQLVEVLGELRSSPGPAGREPESRSGGAGTQGAEPNEGTEGWSRGHG